MKIGLVTGEFPPMEGGVGAFTAELAEALQALKQEVHVLTSRQARPVDGERTLSMRPEPVPRPFGYLHPRINRWRWSSLATIADITLRYELDVVNIQYQAAAYDMRSAAINILPWRLKGITCTAVTFHDLRVPYLFPKAGRLRRAAVNFMARQAHGAIATNGADYAQLRQLLPTPVAQIPIGSNIKAYRPNHLEIAEVRQGLGLVPENCLLGYFGFLNTSKGADTLLQALALLDERFHLVFVGGRTGSSDATNAAFLATIEALAVSLGVAGRVHWTGFLSDARVSAHLHAADLLVMPYRDGASLRRGTLMAALAHGRPLISTWPQDPAPEFLHGDNVWLVDPDNPEELAGAVRKLASQPALRKQLGAAAAHLAGHFTWDQIAAQTLAFFDDLMNKRATTHD